MKKIILFPLSFALLLFLTSCFHKDVMTDRADDVITSFIYQGKEGNFIITKEMIFQATRKSSNGGFTQISGHSDYRISSYDLNTGKLISRVNMKGGMEEGEFTIMGATEGKIWLYSLNKDLGFHIRNPKTLEVSMDQKAITQGLKGITLTNPPWSSLSDFFSFDVKECKPLVTDMQGYIYAINPDNLSTEKIDKKAERSSFLNEYTSTSCNLDKKRTINLVGDNRKTAQLGWKEDAKHNPSFLDAGYIVDDNEYRAGARLKKYTDEINKREKEVEDSIKQFETEHAALKDHDYYDFNASREEEAKFNTYRQQKIYLEMTIDDLKRTLSFSEMEKMALSNEPNTCLVYYRNNISDTARAVISKLKVNADSTFTEVWQCHFNNFYFDPDKANSKGAFETVFSKGDPQFRYKWFDVADNKLVIISQLQMACIDVNTGKVLWEINL